MQNSGKKLKVAFLYDDDLNKNDGVSQYVKTIGAWLSAKGHHVTYLNGQTDLNTYSDGKVFSLSKNVRVKWNGNWLSMPIFPRLKEIAKVVKENEFDIVHVQMPYSPIMAGVVIKKLKSTTSVVGTVHIFPAKSAKNFSTQILRLISFRSNKKIDKVVSVSKAAQQYAKQSLGVESEIVPNAVDVSKYFREQPNIKQKQIIFLGRLVQRKGCEYLIRAFNRAINVDNELRLVIAGDGPQKPKLEKIVKELGISEKVEFVGFVSEEQKIDLLSRSSVACFPSLYGESFGIVLIEAMAANGSIVLAGNNPGYASVMSQSEIQMIDPKNTKEFAERLLELSSNKELRAERKSWQNKTISQYDVNAVGNRLLEIYYDTIANKASKLHN